MVVIGALAGFTAQNAAFRSIGAGHAVERRDLCGRGRRPALLFRRPHQRLPGAATRRIRLSAVELGRRGGAEGRPEKDLPDVVEMFDHISKSVGTPDFGLPHTSKDHPFHLAPRQALEELWPRAKVLLSNADGVLVHGLAGLDSDPEGTGVPKAHSVSYTHLTLPTKA